MSTPFLEKSKESLESAQFLIDEGKNNSSIHCAYYSCVQVLLHLLHNEMGLTDSELKQEIGLYKNSGGKGGSHSYYINRVIKDLQRQNRVVNRLNTNLGDLKKVRVDADYTPKSLSRQDAQKAYNLAKSIIEELSTHYKLPKK